MLFLTEGITDVETMIMIVKLSDNHKVQTTAISCNPMITPIWLIYESLK